MSTKKTLVVILGPTGIGKSDLSIEVAKHFNTEIISCDSRQMYKELKIGTAAPTTEQMSEIKHHFVGNLSIHDYYNASEFEFQVLDLLDKLFQKHDIVIMTGGSGMYIDAVVKGIDDLPTISKEVRDKFLKIYADEGIEEIRELLLQVDPKYYEQADKNNYKRMLKALEVYEMTGKPYSHLRTNTQKKRPFNTVQIGLTMDREKLYERINLRVDKMIEQGLVEEAKQFFEYRHLNSLNTVGYKELFGYFAGKYDYDEAIRLIKRNSRRYAKRQITWWNRDKTIKWYDITNKNEIIDYISSVCK